MCRGGRRAESFLVRSSSPRLRGILNSVLRNRATDAPEVIRRRLAWRGGNRALAHFPELLLMSAAMARHAAHAGIVEVEKMRTAAPGPGAMKKISWE